MATFGIYSGDQLIRRLTLHQDIIKVGRDKRAHLQLDDEGVSRMHAVLENEGGVMTLIDLGSDPGTFVNGTRINKQVLEIGDRVTMGGATFVVEQDSPLDNAAFRLPTAANVRETLGDSFNPGNIYGVAALVLQVDGVRREAWSAETELAVPLFESYPRGTAPPPEIPTAARGHKLIDDTAKSETRRCSTCTVRPGLAPCAVCVGTGGGASSDASDRCKACNGEGFLHCGACEGTTRVVACTIRYVNDEPVRIRRTIVPEIHASIRPFVEARIHPDATWPLEQTFDPEPGLVASAYRGASAVRATEDFQGFFFGDAVSHCVGAREGATTGLARFAVRIYAIPVLWTVTGEHHAAYFYDELGALQVVSG